MVRVGMSQLQLAALSENSATTIQRLLKGKNVKVTTVADIAGAMGYQIKFTLIPEEAK